MLMELTEWPASIKSEAKNIAVPGAADAGDYCFASSKFIIIFNYNCYGKTKWLFPAIYYPK